MTDAINLEGVSVKSLTLLDDKVLVRVVPREEVRASGLFLLHGSPEHQVGSEFYGEVVATGPGTLVREGPSPEEVADFVCDLVRDLIKWDGSVMPEFSGAEPTDCGEKARAFMERRRPMRRVPCQWKPGDRVLVKQGFGVEMDLREGRHHVIERAGTFGHGIIAAWDAEHVHCWHAQVQHVIVNNEVTEEIVTAVCSCGVETEALETRLPSCAACPPGERLAEAVLGGKHVYDVRIPDVPKTPQFDPEDPRFRVGELRPE